MKQKRDRIKRRNAEAAVAEKDDVKGKSDNQPKYLSDQELETMGVLNWSSIRITDTDMDNLKYYDEIPKRKIFYDGGGGTNFVTNLTDDIVCVTRLFLTDHLLVILGRAIELQDESTYRIVHQWTRELHKFLYLKLNEDNEVVSFSVLHTVDFDPLKNKKILLFWITFTLIRNIGNSGMLHHC